VTEVTPLRGFYRAEGDHQDFALKNPDHPIFRCVICQRSKLSNNNFQSCLCTTRATD
jgi:peptide methionine sulfoxide reductase MsrA